VKQREQQIQEESDLVVQEDLILTRDRRVPRLSDLSARPHLSGRKTHGTLEAHQNGLRFTTNKNQKLDILYANVKHAIFQPCDKELVVLIHFHLRYNTVGRFLSIYNLSIYLSIYRSIVLFIYLFI
jgi:nucleosome binding factor SPN SPT16 subunit